MHRSTFTLFIVLFFIPLFGQLKPPKLPPASKEATKVANPTKSPTITPVQLKCAEWMGQYKVFWLHVLHKDNNQTLDMTTKMPRHRVHYINGVTGYMTFGAAGGVPLILPTHRVMQTYSPVSGITNIEMENITILKSYPAGGVSVVEMIYTPGDYADVVGVKDIYLKPDHPQKTYAIIKRANGIESEIVVYDNMRRPPCAIPIKNP